MALKSLIIKQSGMRWNAINAALNQRVLGSSPSASTIFQRKKQTFTASLDCFFLCKSAVGSILGSKDFLLKAS